MCDCATATGAGVGFRFWQDDVDLGVRLDGGQITLAGETRYQAGSWPAPRRVVFKAEILAKGPNTRFVVTTRTDDPLALYDWYVDRGKPENWIKDFKHALAAEQWSPRSLDSSLRVAQPGGADR